MRSIIIEVCGLALLGLLLSLLGVLKFPQPQQPQQPIPVRPCPEPERPRKPLLPWRRDVADPFEEGNRLIEAKATVGGPVAPDGKTEVTCDLPASSGMRAKNVGGRDGAGLCVFTSIMHSARYQNEPRLWNFQTDMRKEPGGGYPSKVDKMIAKYGAGTSYVQYEGSDPSVLDLAIKTGRMPGVTYGYSERYGGRIAHMVNLVHIDSQWACVLDNNFVQGENCLEWMPRDEFLRRWRMGGGGWCVVLLSPAPIPVPTR